MEDELVRSYSLNAPSLQFRCWEVFEIVRHDFLRARLDGGSEYVSIVFIWQLKRWDQAGVVLHQAIVDGDAQKLTRSRQPAFVQLGFCAFDATKRLIQDICRPSCSYEVGRGDPNQQIALVLGEQDARVVDDCERQCLGSKLLTQFGKLVDSRLRTS